MRLNLILICLLLGSCVTQDSIRFDDRKDVGQIQQTIQNASLNDGEKAILVHAINYYQFFKDKYKHPEFIDSWETFMLDYQTLKRKYFSVDQIARKYWESYNDEEKLELLEYQQIALRLDKAIRQLQHVNDIKQAVEFALKSVLFASQMASMIKA